MTSILTPTTNATKAPDSIKRFYNSIYTIAKQKTGDNNPLHEWNKSGISKDYYGSVCAYVWGLPLQQFWEKQGRYITKSVPGGARMNRFYKATAVNESKTIVTPNTQVLYANAFIDLSRSIVQVEYPTPNIKPKKNNIYSQIQLMDPYTNVQFSDNSSRNSRSRSDTRKQVFYWSDARYDIKREINRTYPDAIDLANPQAWILGRIELDPYLNPGTSSISLNKTKTPYQKANQNKQLNLKNIQNFNDQYNIEIPYIGKGARLPRSKVTDASTDYREFFTQLSNAVFSNNLNTYYSGVTNGVLNKSGTVYDQASIFSHFGSGPYSIGLTASESEDGFTGSSSTIKKRFIEKGFENAKQVVEAISSNSNANGDTNDWTINTSLGQYKPSYTGWVTAAGVANAGLGANLASDGTYPQISIQSHGENIRNQDYAITFEAKSLPPINEPGFWSVTVYNSDNSILRCPLNNFYVDHCNKKKNHTASGGVYALGSNQFSYQQQYADAPLTLNLSATQPLRTNDQYGIPTPRSGNFTVVMRLYNPVPARDNMPSKSILSSTDPWIPPRIEELGSTGNGLISKGRLFLDQDRNLKQSRHEPSVRTNDQGQYELSAIDGDGTLILNDGFDQLTGMPYQGKLLAVEGSQLISPMTTIDWGLKELGVNTKARTTLLKRLTETTFEELYGQKLSSRGSKLDQARTIAPHQIARSTNNQEQKLAKTHVISNILLGEITTAAWQDANEQGNREDKLSTFRQNISTISQQIAAHFAANTPANMESLYRTTAETFNAVSSSELFRFTREASDLPYHDFIEALIQQP